MQERTGKRHSIGASHGLDHAQRMPHWRHATLLLRAQCNARAIDTPLLASRHSPPGLMLCCSSGRRNFDASSHLHTAPGRQMCSLTGAHRPASSSPLGLTRPVTVHGGRTGSAVLRRLDHDGQDSGFEELCVHDAPAAGLGLLAIQTNYIRAVHYRHQQQSCSHGVKSALLCVCTLSALGHAWARRRGRISNTCHPQPRTALATKTLKKLSQR